MEIGEILGRVFPRKRVSEITHPIPLPKDKLKPRVVIPAGNSELNPSYHHSAYLDKETLDKEVFLLETEISRININPITSPKEKEVQKQNGLIAKFWQANDFMVDLENKFSEQLAKGVTVQDAQTHRVLRTGTALFMTDCLHRLRTFAAGKEFEAQFTSYIDLLKYRYLGWTSIRINGISIEDMMNKETAVTLSPSSLYKFFYGSYSVKRRISHNEILKENTQHPQQEYPNITKNYIEIATADILAATDIPKNALDRLGVTGTTAEYIQWAKQFIDRAHELYQKPYLTALDPQSSEFPLLKQTVKVLLEQKWADRMLAVHFLCLKEPSRIRDLYRKTRKFAQEGNNPDFYNLLANTALEYAKARSSDNILTRENVVMLINENSGNPAIPTFEDLRTIGNETFQKSSQQEYFVDPNQIGIDWSNLVIPSKVSVKFPEGNARKLDVALHYENQEGETLDLTLQIDTKKGKQELDWSFMESPDDPEMKTMHDAVMLATRQILLSVKKQAEAKWQERQKAKEPKFQPSPTSSSNEAKPKPEIPYVPREKEAKPKPQKPLMPIEQILSGNTPVPVDEKVKRNIALPQEKDIQKMMNGISPDNQTMIRDKIQEFNERGVGNFKALPGYITPEGKKVYELRAGDYRVLLTEVSKGNGNGNNKTHEFEVYKIGDRGEIFKPRQKN